MIQFGKGRGQGLRGFSVPLVLLVAVGCAGTINGSIRPDDRSYSAITVVNEHPRNVRVSLITDSGQLCYLGTVDAISQRVIEIPTAYSESTVRLLLVAQSRSFRTPPEGTVRVTSVNRPQPVATEYTIEQVTLARGRSLELRIGAYLNQSRVVARN